MLLTVGGGGQGAAGLFTYGEHARLWAWSPLSGLSGHE